MANIPIPATYPYPDTLTPIDFDVDIYDNSRMVWRQSLNDTDVRSFAADYKMGRTDEASYDGYQEYLHRGLDRKDIVSKSQKPPAKRKRRKS